uniref:Malate dehydrogenase n=1 Tax=Cyclophora tenuis TaxID=216820 RepID=A0A7S1GNK2_CYCTE|mmetsp:Transcript_25344/g.43135  ORF Transcript_25344/g.43135 Transcript_25344/m.43135 type:complete len:364 (+) Transcript_25344:62-1153(+)
MLALPRVVLRSVRPSQSAFRHLSTAEPGFVSVKIEEAQSTTARALRQIGWDDDDANLQAEIMTAAELCGNNQGLVKMYQPQMMAPAKGAGKPVVERETPTSAVINANQAPGMLAAVTAADLAASKVLEGETAVSVVSSYNTSTSSGQLAFYVNRMAQKGLVSVALCNSPEMVAAAAGGKPVFGTNPLAVAVPTATGTFSFDMATSAIALFGVLTAKSKGEPLPPNVAYDEHGNWTTDAATALGDGAIATFGGHKGAGLSLCVELLAGALSGGAVLGQVESKKEARSWGHTFLAIQPDCLVDDFPAKASSIIETVKSSGEGIRIPGERSAQIAAERKAAGVMPIPEKIWESICHTAEYGISKSS